MNVHLLLLYLAAIASDTPGLLLGFLSLDEEIPQINYPDNFAFYVRTYLLSNLPALRVTLFTVYTYEHVVSR